MKNLMWSFSPWVAFLLGVRVGGVYWGAAIGLVVALVVLVRAITRAAPTCLTSSAPSISGVCLCSWPLSPQ